MSHDFLPALDAPRDSLGRRWPPRLKLLLALGMLLVGSLLSIERWPLAAALFAVQLLGYRLARIPWGYVLKRLAAFLPFALVFAVSLPASQGFDRGWNLAATVLLRAVLAFLSVLWLAGVLQFSQLLVALRQCRVPELLVALLAFMYRYLFLLRDEVATMRAARQARTFGRMTLRNRWKIAAQLIGMLLIRGLRRAERVHRAMSARGYSGEVRLLDD